MSRDDARQAVFGGFDGLASAVGLVAALAAHGGGQVIRAAIALAAGAAVSMAAGEWLADPQRQTRRALVMGGSTLAGSIAPAIPFLLAAGNVADVGCAAVTAGCGVAIAELRPGGRAASYAATFGVLAVACAAAVAASLAAG